MEERGIRKRVATTQEIDRNREAATSPAPCGVEAEVSRQVSVTLEV
jgi:hypothetical protein